MAREKLEDKDQAVRWWQSHVESDQLVLPRADLPSGPGKRMLLAGGYATEMAKGQAWILKTPERASDRDLCLRNYWPIVSAVLTNYEPSVVERESAVRLEVGDFTPPALLRVRHQSSESRYRFEICRGLEIQLVAGTVEPDAITEIEVMETTLPVDRSEHTLLALPLPAVRDNLEDISVWLSTLVLSRPALEEEWSRHRRPVLLKRFSEMARDAGNERLHRQLEDFLVTEYEHHVSRARSGVGSEVVVPTIVSRARAPNPWMTRHRIRFERFADQMEDALGGEIDDVERLGPDGVIEQAREGKSYDTYHSTAIEGYQISPEDVSAVLSGEERAGQDPEEVRARMAVKGYSVAFDRCMDVIRSSDGAWKATVGLIHDLYDALFSPSVEAGILSAGALRGWRTEPAYLRSARHVPPSAEKVPQLMQQHVELVNQTETSPVVRAAASHLDFVTIHPFPDGNGRIGRFLMNLVLGTSGLPWVTIRAEDRGRYFEALDAAQVGGDAQMFGEFVVGYVEDALSGR